MTAAWGIAATYTASVASFAFHDPGFADPGTKFGVISTFVSCTIMTAIYVWFARVTLRVKASVPPANAA